MAKDGDGMPIGIRTTDDLRQMLALGGPWVSAVIDVPLRGSGSPAASTTWSPHAQQLEAAGAPPELLEAVGRRYADPARQGAPLAVFASPDGLAECWLDPGSAPVPSADFGAFPRLVSVLCALATRAPAVGVLLDRAGADLHVLDGDGIDDTSEVSGDTEHVHKGAPGGWSQRRFQTRAELTWDRNAADVAAELAEQVRATGAAMVAVSGDERARGYLHDHMPSDLAGLVHDVAAGGRKEPESPERLVGATRDLLGAAATAVRERWLAKLAEEVGQRDHAVTGAPATFTALTEGGVDVVFLGVGNGDGLGYAGGPRGPWSASADALTDLGLEPIGGPVADVAVAAALVTGAHVVVLGSEEELPATDGVAAVLRFRTEEG
jgi:hypothetical protein